MSIASAPSAAARSLIAGVLMFVAQSLSAQVLNTNSTFDTDTWSWGWFYSCNGSGPPCGNGSSASMYWSSFGNGTGSMEIVWNDATYPGYRFGVQNDSAKVSVVPGATYTYSADFFPETPAPSGSMAGLYVFGGGIASTTSATIPLSPIWTRMGGTFVAGPSAETASLEVGFPQVFGAAYYVDNVSISGPRGPGRAVGFMAAPTTTTAGSPVTLSWTAVDTTSATVNGQPVPGCCSPGIYNPFVQMTVYPTTTTTYDLVSTGPGGSSTWSGSPVTVTVASSCPTMTSSNVFFNYSGSQSGCSSLYIAPLTPPPCQPAEAVTFTASSSGYPFSCASHTFDWNFGDGTTASGQSVAHSFAAQGTYTVSLTMANGSQTFTVSKAITVAAPGPTASLTVSPSTIQLGQSALLSWTTSNASSVVIDNNIGLVAPSGSMSVSPLTTTSYTLTATSASGATTTSTATLNVIRPCVLACSATVPSTGTAASAVQFSGSVQATDCSTPPTVVWSFGDGSSSTQTTATHVYTSPGTYTWTLTANTPEQMCQKSGNIVINPAVPLRIASFIATPLTVRAGDRATLSWVTEGAESVVIDNGVGTQPPAGSITVRPSTTTTYTLTAKQGTSTLKQTATVEVVTLPAIDVTQFPAALVQLQDAGGATATYALTNSGGGPSSITITQNGDFFDQTPKSFTLAPGTSQVITIVGKGSPAGVFEGNAIISGSGVPANLQIPVRLLSTPPPTGTVSADANTSRVDVAAPPETNPTGTISFTNHGNVTLTGVLTSDVPWIIPQSGVVTIPAGATVTLTFKSDRSKRPDASSLIGSAEGTLRLSFLGGSGFTKKGLDSGSSAISVELVRVVDTVQTSVAPGTVPAIAPGEVAIFIPGVGHFSRTGQGSSRLEFLSDVSLLNAQDTRALQDVKLYYTSVVGNSAAAQTTTIPPTPANVSVALADAAKNIFGVNEQVGTMHVRSKDASKMLVAATSIASGSPTGAIGTNLPVMRSDRAARTGEVVALAGVGKDATAHTDLYLQETAGLGATVEIRFRDGNGATVGSPQTVTIDPFKLREMPDVVPAGALSAILTNTSTNGATFLAYASLVDEQNKDRWIVADWSRQYGYRTDETVIVPIAGSLRGANGTFYRSDVAIANRANAVAGGKLRYTSRGGVSVEKQITLAPLATAVLPDAISSFFDMPNDLGYLTFVPAAGTSFAVSSRAYTTATGQSGVFSSSIPAVARSAALPNGGSVVIASLEDADRRVLSATRPGTFRTNAALVETSGKPATVRVTLRYVFPAGLSAQGVGSSEPREYVIGANGILFLNSIADELLTTHRQSDVTGDLKRIEATFQVVGGDGQVLVVTSSVDNRSGDSIVRSQ